MSNKVKIMGVALLAVALNSTALTLGRLRGAALVGQPLDLAVPVQLGEGEDASQCFEAEVLYADTRQDASQVRIVVEPVAPDRSLNVRILSSAFVDEPVVTVNFRAGCAQKTSRRYVLLADAPRDTAAQPTPRTAPLAVLAPPPLARPLGTPSPTSNASASVTPTARPARPAEPAVVKTKRPKAVEPIKLPPPSGQSRLKLDPLDLFSDRVANLDSFMTFELPEDALRSAQRLQALEATVKANLALVAKNEASMADLKRRLEQAESERIPAAWLYGLLALALASMAGVAYLLMRQRPTHSSNSDWLKAPAQGQDSLFLEPELVPPAAPKAAPPPAAAHAVLPLEEAPPDEAPESVLHSRPMSEMDVNLIEMTDSKFNAFMISDAARLERQRPLSAAAPLQAKKQVMNLNPEAALDIRQQAEFFVSLGQTDRAVRILKKQIEVGDDVNPSLYLDLFAIYHAHNLKIEFQHLRDEFNSLFTGTVPEFAHFKSEGNDLTLYPEVVKRIAELWPTPGVLVLIEGYIFSDPSHPQSRTFALAAFRDLLLLHAVAQSIALQSSDKGAGTPASAPVNFADIDFTESGKPYSTPVASDLDVDIGLDLDLDLDLSLDLNLSDSAPNSVALEAGKISPTASSPLQFDLPELPHKG